MIQDNVALGRDPWISKEETLAYHFRVTEEKGSLSMGLYVKDRAVQFARCSLDALACIYEEVNRMRCDVLLDMKTELLRQWTTGYDDKLRVLHSVLEDEEKKTPKLYAQMVRSPLVWSQDIWIFYVEAECLLERYEIKYDRYDEAELIKRVVYQEFIAKLQKKSQ